MHPCQRHQKLPSTCSRISRRTLLGGLAAGTLAGCSRRSRSVDPRWPSHEIGTNSPVPQAPILGSANHLGMPGPYPGRVIEVQHPGSVTDGERDQTAIKMMIQRGMQQLVPEAETAVDDHGAVTVTVRRRRATHP